MNDNERFLLEEVVKKNFSAKYKDSVLGILWSVLQPLLIMIILTIIFSTIFKGSISNYPVYLLSGRCMFSFVTGAVTVSMSAISANKNILLKTSTPKYIFVIGSIISEFINFLITFGLLIVIMIVTDCPFHFAHMPLAIIPIISAIIMVTGLGLIVSILSVYYTDIKHLWSVMVMALMYASAIFYPMDIIPEPYQSIMIQSPVYWLIDQFRCFIFYGTFPSLLNVIDSLLLSAIILVFGIIVYITYEKKVLMKF